jgi:hypothetical protein
VNLVVVGGSGVYTEFFEIAPAQLAPRKGESQLHRNAHLIG